MIKTVTRQQVAIVTLTLLFILSSAFMIHFWFFASQGARYTWEDGQIEEKARKDADHELQHDIDKTQLKVNDIEHKLNELIEKINKLNEIK